jgi:putative transposase
MHTHNPYPSDLTDAHWQLLEPLLPPRRDPRGAKPKHSRLALLNAIFYVTRYGCTWNALPHDFPPYKTVQDFHRKLVKRGVWERIMDALRCQVRQQAKREPEPSIVVMDSQSVKTTEKGGHAAWTATSG